MPRRTKAQIWADDAVDRLYDHYAEVLVATKNLKREDAVYALSIVTEGPWSPLLGQPQPEDDGKPDTYPILRALVKAGIASTEETVQWRELNEVEPEPEPEAEPVKEGYDPEAEPADFTLEELSNADDAELRQLIYQVAELRQTEKDAKDTYDKLRPQISELVRRKGKPVSFIHPVTGVHKIATYVQRNSLVIDPGQLLQALVDYYGDNDQAEAIWTDCLKPREVDTKEGGRFHEAVRRHSDEVNGVPPEVVAAVARFAPQDPFVSFVNP